MTKRSYEAIMFIQSTRFGRLQVDHSDLLLMPQGLIGYETCRHWILLSSDQSPFVAWLQSVGLANVAVPVVSPRKFAPDYRVHVIKRQIELLQLRADDQLYVLTVVSKNGLTLTTNLKSPILLNASRQIGVQVVSVEDAPLALPIGLTTSGQNAVQRAA